MVRLAISAANTAAIFALPLCAESAVPEEATWQEKVPGQESNGVFFCDLGALKKSIPLV